MSSAQISKIGIVDYGSGNTRSVCNAIAFNGANFVLSSSAEELGTCSHLILPGVGSYRHCMEALERTGLVPFLSEQVLQKGKFFLGICVGMQLITETGHEFGEYKGLGWMKGSCERLSFEGEELHLPQVGWNEVEAGDVGFPLFRGLEKPTFYFVHSFAVKPAEEVNAAYGYYGTKFVAAVQKGNIFGVQFHPEKSQSHGLAVLKNFCELS